MLRIHAGCSPFVSVQIGCGSLVSAMLTRAEIVMMKTRYPESEQTAGKTRWEIAMRRMYVEAGEATVCCAWLFALLVDTTSTQTVESTSKRYQRFF